MGFTRGARIALLGVLTSLAIAALPGVANAGVLVESAPSCDNGKLEQPFQRWLDPSSYFIVPGGSFEGDVSGWKLAGGARVVSGNEPWQVHGDAGTRSLQIPAGGSAVTPAVCVGLEHPTLRLFARRGSTSLLSTVSALNVSVIAETSVGATVEVPVGAVAGGTSWQPTPPYLVVANLLPLLPGNYTPVAFRFRAVGLSDWRIDDVYVDPRYR
jgi:hypothetical protein